MAKEMPRAEKRRKQQSERCPKCKAKLIVGDWRKSCRRCGYTKVIEPSNLTKRLMGF